MVVWISGPTGAGKTTLSRALAKSGFLTIEETLPAERFRSFVRDPIANCAELQETIMLSRYEAWMRLPDRSRVAFDRSLDEDAQVFCKMHYELGLLNEQQLHQLTQLSIDLQKEMQMPDLIIFMTAQLQALAERVTERTHPPVIVQNLKRQAMLYLDWLATRREDTIRLDNSACAENTIRQLFQEK